MNKTVKTLYLMCGIPASGKSVYAREFAKKIDAVYVSRDEIRFSLLKDGEDYFSHENEVLATFYKNIQKALDSEGICVADATHLSWSARSKIFNNLNLDDVQVILIIMDTALSVCLERNKRREGLARVPDRAICNMWYSFKAPNTEEAKLYSKIIHIKTQENGVINNV